MKRCLLLLLLLLWIAPSCLGEENTPLAGETVLNPGELPEYVEWLLQVAKEEIGYTEEKNSYTKYGEWSGDSNAAWCAEFICWCVDQTDARYGTQLLQNIYPKWSGQNTGKNWFIREGRFVFRKGYCQDWGYQWEKGADHYLTKNEYIPRPGDVVFFSYNQEGDTEHVALVEYCTMDSSGEVILHVIEGNNPDRVQRNSYKLDNSQVLGFGLPVDRVDTVCRYGNTGTKVRQLQEKLSSLGYLAEEDVTATFGSHTKKAVVQFQKEALGLDAATGIADRVTTQAMDALYEAQVENDPDTWLVEE